MMLLFLLYFSLIFCNANTTSAKELTNQIRILSTASLINKKYEMRKDEYIRSLNILRQFGYDYYVVENCLDTNSRTFINDFCNNVYYSYSNNMQITNKGINEIVAMKAALDYFNFDDNDMIIKITGRYYFETDDFIKLVECHPEFDAFVRYGKPGDFVSHDHVFTGCFAMRCGELKKMLALIDLEKMYSQNIGIEEMTAWYVAKLNPDKVHKVDKLYMTANIFFDGSECKLTHW